MAKAEKVEVVLSSTDRQLLRDIRDALRALGVEPGDPDAVRRLVESGPRDKWDYRFLDDHYAADSKGYTWNGSGWVPKE